MSPKGTDDQQINALRVQTRAVIQSLRTWCDTAEALVEHPGALAAIARGLLVPNAPVVHLDAPTDGWTGAERRNNDRRLHSHPSEGSRRMISAVPPLADE